jgi:hypothetical protein
VGKNMGEMREVDKAKKVIKEEKGKGLRFIIIIIIIIIV